MIKYASANIALRDEPKQFKVAPDLRLLKNGQELAESWYSPKFPIFDIVDNGQMIVIKNSESIIWNPVEQDSDKPADQLLIKFSEGDEYFMEVNVPNIRVGEALGFTAGSLSLSLDKTSLRIIKTLKALNYPL